MTTGQALLVFLAIPVGFVAFVALAVYAASWTRGSRAVGTDVSAADSSPLLVTSGSAVPDPGVFSIEASVSGAPRVGGGARGQW